MGLKKDIWNDNLFFKMVTDIVIPDYYLRIKNISKKFSRWLTIFFNMADCIFQDGCSGTEGGRRS